MWNNKNRATRCQRGPIKLCRGWRGGGKRRSGWRALCADCQTRGVGLERPRTSHKTSGRLPLWHSQDVNILTMRVDATALRNPTSNTCTCPHTTHDCNTMQHTTPFDAPLHPLQFNVPAVRARLNAHPCQHNTTPASVRLVPSLCAHTHTHRTDTFCHERFLCSPSHHLPPAAGSFRNRPWRPHRADDGPQRPCPGPPSQSRPSRPGAPLRRFGPAHSTPHATCLRRPGSGVTSNTCARMSLPGTHTPLDPPQLPA